MKMKAKKTYRTRDTRANDSNKVQTKTKLSTHLIETFYC